MGCLASALRLLPTIFAMMTSKANSVQKSVNVFAFHCKEGDAECAQGEETWNKVAVAGGKT